MIQLLFWILYPESHWIQLKLDKQTRQGYTHNVQINVVTLGYVPNGQLLDIIHWLPFKNNWGLLLAKHFVQSVEVVTQL